MGVPLLLAIHEHKTDGSDARGEDLHYAYVAGQLVLRYQPDRRANTVAYPLGHNGCGKTTLLEILGGVRAQRGEVTLDG